MNDPTPGLRPLRRFRNRANSQERFEVRLEPGEEIELPEGSVVDQDRTRLEAEPKKAPAVKAPAKRPAKKS